jgi:hypothetical protein
MELLFAIVAFVVVSVIADAIEGKKKKQQQSDLPRDKARIKIDGQEKRPEIIIPTIKGAPTMQSDMQIVYHEAEPFIKAEPIEKLKKPEVVRYQSLKTETKPVNSVNVQPEVMLSAVCYAQILQPPKAYQYMRNRPCLGDQNNHKS